VIVSGEARHTTADDVHLYCALGLHEFYSQSEEAARLVAHHFQ